jgi:hypothetical protein
MAYTTAEARIQMLDDLAHAIDEIGVALGALGEAYELLDEQNGDRMEEQLFRPVQVTYGRAKRTYSGFAERTGWPPASSSRRPRARRSERARGDGRRDRGDRGGRPPAGRDPGLDDAGRGRRRAAARGLAEIRELVGPLPERGSALLRTLGR